MHVHVVSAMRCAGVALALLVSATAAWAQQGTILVQVTEQGTARPVEAVQVNVSGTNLGGVTNSEGRLLLRNVPPGTVQVRALRVGYAEQRKPVQVASGQQASVDFTLAQVAVSIAPVVTTATGQTAREELGNAVSTINVSRSDADGAGAHDRRRAELARAGRHRDHRHADGRRDPASAFAARAASTSRTIRSTSSTAFA